MFLNGCRMPLLPKNNNKGLVIPYKSLHSSFPFQMRWLDPLIKVAIFGLLLAGVYYQLSQNQNVDDIGRFLRAQKQLVVLFGVLAVTGLMIINWLIETFKWQQLLQPVVSLPRKQAVKGVLLGVTVSLFTPNRIGEYGGRMWVVPKGKRAESVVATIIGSIARWIVNIGIGGIGAAILLFVYSGIAREGIWFLMLASVVLLSILIALFSNLYWLEHLFDHFRMLRKYKHYLYFVRKYSVRQLVGVVALSLLRYSVYCLQLIALVAVFGIKIEYLTSAAIVNTLFFFQTLVPSIALMELGIRGNLALYLFSFFTTNAIAVLSATFALWGINLLLPALAGYCLLLHTRITKS